MVPEDLKVQVDLAVQEDQEDHRLASPLEDHLVVQGHQLDLAD